MGKPPPRRSPFRLALPPIAVPLDAIVSPERGTGELIWYELPHAPKFGARLSLQFSALPWAKTGMQPFAWQWVAAVGALATPILRVAVARGVTVTQFFFDGVWTRQMRAGDSPPGAGPIKGRPILLLCRPQDDGLIPDPDEAFDAHRIIGEPYTIDPTRSGSRTLLPEDPRYRTLDEFQKLQVTPYETGVVIAQRDGAFEVHIRLTELGEQVAFAFDIDPDEVALGAIVRIVHTRSVEVHVKAHESVKDLLIVKTFERPTARDVPPQGSSLLEGGHLFRDHEIDELVPDPRRLLTIVLIELVISAIPVGGVLYDLGQIAFAAATGKNFWGYSVSRDELLLMGFCAAIPLAAGAASTIRSLQATVSGTKLQRILEAETLAEIQRVADTGFVEAARQLSPRQADSLTAALQRHLAGPRAFPLPALVDKLNDLIGDAYLLSLERRALGKVFTADFSGFRHPQLNAAYNKYKSSPRFRRNPELAEDPAAWAKRQSAATRGAPRALLRQALGDDFVKVINRALEKKTVPRLVTKADIDNYDKVFRLELGSADYGTLRNLGKTMPGFGQVFEFDHLLEQRFWRNNPELVSAFDEAGLGIAVVVPKNAAVARSMFVQFGGERIRYVHTVKTFMLRELIPHGAEAFFTVQEAWYAHVHVLKSLGADPSLFGRLAQDFELMAVELGQQFVPRMPSPDILLHANGWPRVFKNPDGSWTIIRTR